MLQTVLSAASPLDDAMLRIMFAARKSVFVDLLKWDVPVVDDLYEVDQFDTEHATYIVLAGLDGQHLGSARLLPTQRPHLIDSIFAELCEEAPPRAASTFEITRFCLDRSLSATMRRSVRDALVLALVDHALAQGITRYSAIAEMAWFQQILTFGWTCRTLGVPRILGGRVLAALAIEIDRTTRGKLIAAGIGTVPMLRFSERIAG